MQNQDNKKVKKIIAVLDKFIAGDLADDHVLAMAKDIYDLYTEEIAKANEETVKEIILMCKVLLPKKEGDFMSNELIKVYLSQPTTKLEN